MPKAPRTVARGTEGLVCAGVVAASDRSFCALASLTNLSGQDSSQRRAIAGIGEQGIRLTPFILFSFETTVLFVLQQRLLLANLFDIALRFSEPLLPLVCRASSREMRLEHDMTTSQGMQDLGSGRRSEIEVLLKVESAGSETCEDEVVVRSRYVDYGLLELLVGHS